MQRPAYAFTRFTLVCLAATLGSSLPQPVGAVSPGVRLPELTQESDRPLPPQHAQVPNFEPAADTVPPPDPSFNEPPPPTPLTAPRPPFNTPPPQTFTPTPNTIPPDLPYTLDSGDVLQINIFDVPEYSGQYALLVDGGINLPLVGEVNLRGLSVEAAKTKLEALYRPYLVRPFISVTLISPRPVNLVVSGEVTNPGAYTVNIVQNATQFPTLTDALNLANGVTLSADIRQVQLRRTYQTQEQIYTLNLWDLLNQGDARQDIQLRDGDSLFIPTAVSMSPNETRQLLNASFAPDASAPVQVAVVGQINRPGAYSVVSNPPTGKPPTVTQAIQTAGGIKPSADVRDIRVRRLTRAGTEELFEVNLWAMLNDGDIDQDISLRSGDTIIVPEAATINSEEINALTTTSFAPEQMRIAVVGEVVRPGPQVVPPNTTLSQGILAAGGFNKSRARQGSVELVRLNPDGTVTNRRVEVSFGSPVDEQTNPLLRPNDVVVVDRSGLASTTDTLEAVLSPFTGIFSFLNFFRIFGILQTD
ncbi:SLBB domain-containing protein [Spirulina sp.]|uniref:polysaccharide biosynthesis/export family protein n=1 Tax=Spirulina sp. TaxID=1157 RepID=UPI003F70D2DC